MASVLIVTPEAWQALELGLRNTVGRDPASTIPLCDGSVSNAHCLIERRGAAFVLRDLGSRNGTLLNGRPVSREESLQEGDEILLGDTRLVFRSDQQAAPGEPVVRKPKAPPVLVTTPSVAGDHLLREVGTALSLLRELLEHERELGRETTRAIAATRDDVQRRLAREHVVVAVVGEKKAGKSTLLNAILGERVLGVAGRECTGTVTRLRRAPEIDYDARMRDGTRMRFKQRHPDRSAHLRAGIEAAREQLRRHGARAEGLNADLEKARRADVDAANALLRAERMTRDADRTAGELSVDSATNYAVLIAGREAEAGTAEAHLLAAREQLGRDTSAAVEAEARLGGSISAMTAAWHTAITAREHETRASRDVVQATHAVELSRMALPVFFRDGLPWWAVWWWLLRALCVAFWWQSRSVHRANLRAIAATRLIASQSTAGREAALATEARHARERADAQAACDMAQQQGAASRELVRDSERRVEGLRSAIVLLRAKHSAAEEARRCRGARDRAAQARGQAAEVLRRAASAVTDHGHEETRLRAALAQVERQLADHLTERRKSFLADVQDLTDMAGKGADVDELTLDHPGLLLPSWLHILDTPGVNTDHAGNKARAWKAIREEADGCILVADLKLNLRETTLGFLAEVRPVVPHVVLVLTQVDRALRNAEGDDNPEEQVEEARRVGVKRFAKATGRAPETVLSIAVAAEASLAPTPQNAQFGALFPGEVARLFDVLHRERAVMLGARAEASLRSGVGDIGAAQSRADASYRERIKSLEDQRIPDPSRFRGEQLAGVRAAVRRASSDVTAKSVAEAQRLLAAQNNAAHRAIAACSDKDGVKAAVARIQGGFQHTVSQVLASVATFQAARTSEAIAELSAPLLEGVRERYRIVQRIAASDRVVRDSAAPAASPGISFNVEGNLAGAVSSFEDAQLGVGIGGAAAGAVIGTFILPGIGSLIGGALGALASLLVTVDSLKEDCGRKLDDTFASVEAQITQALNDGAADLTEGLLQSVGSVLDEALVHFDGWILGVLDAERRVIEGERARLQHLVGLRTRLERQDEVLRKAMEAAVRESQGLCGTA